MNTYLKGVFYENKQFLKERLHNKFDTHIDKNSKMMVIKF